MRLVLNHLYIKCLRASSKKQIKTPNNPEQLDTSNNWSTLVCEKFSSQWKKKAVVGAQTQRPMQQK